MRPRERNRPTIAWDPALSARTWILLADSSSARCYESQPALREWKPGFELEHPESRAKGADLTSDKPGRAPPSGDLGHRGALEPHTPRKKVEAETFARQLARTLEKRLDEGSFDRLILVMAPQFLGLLRAELVDRVGKRVHAVVERDYLHLPLSELKERVEEQLKAR